MTPCSSDGSIKVLRNLRSGQASTNVFKLESDVIYDINFMYYLPIGHGLFLSRLGFSDRL